MYFICFYRENIYILNDIKFLNIFKTYLSNKKKLQQLQNEQAQNVNLNEINVYYNRQQQQQQQLPTYEEALEAHIRQQQLPPTYEQSNNN